jgi:hypothetical protein
MRYKIGKDDLQSITNGFKVNDDGNLIEVDDDKEEEVDDDDVDYEQFLLELDATQPEDRDCDCLPKYLNVGRSTTLAYGSGTA